RVVYSRKTSSTPGSNTSACTNSIPSACARTPTNSPCTTTYRHRRYRAQSRPSGRLLRFRVSHYTRRHQKGGAVGEVVTRSTDEGVAVLTLNRPDRLNAWTHEMKRVYFDLLEDCAADPDVRVIVLTGAGRGFCAGADMDELSSVADGGLEASAAEAAQDTRPQTFPLSIPKPIIAAINGPCAGLGVVHALMCDLRF